MPKLKYEMVFTKRISPEEVVAAYKKRGLKAIQNDFRDDAGNVCAIVIICQEAGANAAIYHVMDWAMRHFGAHYRRGFLNGFDSYPYVPTRQKRYNEGYEDGVAAREACVNEDLFI